MSKWGNNDVTSAVNEGISCKYQENETCFSLMLSWNVFSKVRKDMTALPSRNLIENTDMPSLSDKSFFPLSSDNFWLHTIHINFFCNVTRGEHKNVTFYKSNAQPYQQNWFWPLWTKKIWFVKPNWISDKRDFRIFQHFLICPTHVSCH